MLFRIRYYIWTDIIYVVRMDVPNWSYGRLFRTSPASKQKEEVHFLGTLTRLSYLKEYIEFL